MRGSNKHLTQNIEKKPFKIISTLETKRQIAKVGTSVAILLLTYSVLTTELRFGSLGLIHSLPFTFFIAMSLLVACSVLLWNEPDKNNRIITIQLIIFLAGLWLVPFLIELSPNRSSYICVGFIDYIIRHGTLNPEVAFYHNWPAHSILCATLANVLGITDFSILIGLTPFFSNCFYFLALCLLRRFMRNEGLATAWWPMVWIFFIANYIQQDNFIPQGMAYFLFLLFVGLFLLSRSADSYASGSNGTLIMLLLFFSMTIAHTITPLIACITIILLDFRRRKYVSPLFIPAMVILVAWTIYGAIVYFSSHMGGFLNEAFNMEMSFQQNVVRVGATGDYLVDQVSIYYTAVLLVLSMLGWLTTNPGRLKASFTRLSIAPLFLPFFHTYGGEMITRTLLFLLLPVAFFSSTFFRNKRVLAFHGIIIFLIIATPLHIISHYGNEEYNYISPAERVAADFFFEKRIHIFEIVTENDPIFRQRDLECFVVVLTSASTLRNNKIIGHWSKWEGDPQYAVISRGTWVAYRRFKSDVDRSKLRNLESFLQTSTSYGCIYANNDSKIYTYNGV